MKPTLPDVDGVLQLPSVRTAIAPPEWGDHNGHVNVLAHYEFHMRASEDAVVQLGVTEDYRQRHGQSVFSLEHHIAFHDEVLVGQEISAHFRMLDRSEKLLHAVTILVNRTTNRIANSIEFVEAHVDLTSRRACPFQPELAGPLDVLLEQHRQLSWEFPLSGSMGLRSGAAHLAPTGSAP